MSMHLIMAALLLAAPPVTFDGDAGLPIRIDGRVVLQTVNEPPSGGGGGVLQRIDGDAGFTLSRPHARQEFAVVDGKGEYTFEFHLPASDDAFRYVLHVPLEHGTNVRVVHAGYRFPQTATFAVGTDDADYAFARYVEIDSAQGAFAIDFDPIGSWQNFGDFDMAVRTCHVRNTEDGIDIAFVRGANRWGGGRIMAKLVIYPQATPFAQIHPFDRSSYKTTLAQQCFIDFTNAGKDYAAGLDAFDAERGYGWVNPDDSIQLVRYSGTALFHSALVRGDKPATFRLKAVPGWHMLTQQFGDREQAVGPMNVAINGTHRIIGFELDAARFTSKRMIVETDGNGIIDIEFTGRPWSIDGLVLQPLLTRQEDYLFTRGWWNQDVQWP